MAPNVQPHIEGLAKRGSLDPSFVILMGGRQSLLAKGLGDIGTGQIPEHISDDVVPQSFSVDLYETTVGRGLNHASVPHQGLPRNVHQ